MGLLAFGGFAYDAVLFEVSLVLALFGTEVSLECCELGVGVITCLGKLGIVVFTYGLEARV